jgi:hypothetical protein
MCNDVDSTYDKLKKALPTAKLSKNRKRNIVIVNQGK